MKTRDATFLEFIEAEIEEFKMAGIVAIYLMIGLSIVALIAWIMMTVFMGIPAETIGEKSTVANNNMVGLAPVVLLIALFMFGMRYFEGGIQVHETKKGKEFIYQNTRDG